MWNVEWQQSGTKGEGENDTGSHPAQRKSGNRFDEAPVLSPSRTNIFGY